MARSHKSVRTKARGWEALDSNNGKSNLWFFAYWQAQQTLCLSQSLEILQDVRICFKVSTTGWSRGEHQSLTKLFKLLVEEPWLEVYLQIDKW